jgi:hypothetical protein
MIERGHASPRETPSICVRVEGQMGASELMSMSQKVGRRMMGTEEA